MKFQAVDIGNSASSASIVFDALRKAIIAGDLKDGDPLRQDEIARMFNTSRIPVREALTRLEQQGLVKATRYKGAVVAGLSLSQAGEIFDFRSLVEGEIILRAVPRMTPALLAEARRLCERLDSARDPLAWGDLNRRFHATLYAACDLPYHLAAVGTAMDRIDRYLRAHRLMGDGMRGDNSEHLEILAACEAGDAAAAQQRTVAHIQNAKASLADHLT